MIVIKDSNITRKIRGHNDKRSKRLGIFLIGYRNHITVLLYRNRLVLMMR